MEPNTNPIAVVDSAKMTRGEVAEPDIVIYSHSPILYWWPVWMLGFVFALVSYLDGGRMAYVPAGTAAQGHQLVAPDPATELDPPHDRMAQNPYLGTWFAVVFLVVFVASNVPLRGLWEWVSILVIALVISVFSWWNLWSSVFDWFRLLHIHINLAGYLFLATWLFAFWIVTVFIFDRRTYVIFSAGQVRVLNEIGEAEKVYDVTNMTFQVLPNVFIRHRILGFWGAGDLIINTGGPRPETLEWSNVLFARSRLAEIQARLKAREVV